MSRYEEIIKESRKKANKLFLLTGVILTLIGLAFCAAGIIMIIRSAFANKNICVQDPAKLKKGQWYTIETNTLLDSYASNNDGVDFITWVGPDYDTAAFISIFVPQKKVAKADQITDDTYDFLTGASSSLSNEWLTGKGYLRKMEDDEKRYYESWFQEQGLSSEDYMMLTFSMVNPWTAMGEQEVRSLFILGIIMVLAGLILIVLRILGRNWSGLKKMKEKYGVTDSEIAADMETALVAANAYVGNRFTFVSQASPALFMNKHLIWVYPAKNTTVHRTYGIKTGETVTYSVNFCDREGVTKACNVKTEEISKEIVGAIHVRAPYVICGYNKHVEDTIRAGQVKQVAAYVDKERQAFEGSGPRQEEDYLGNNYGQQRGGNPYAPQPEAQPVQQDYAQSQQAAQEAYAQQPQQSAYAPQQEAQPVQQNYAQPQEAYQEPPFGYEPQEFEEPTSVMENPFDQ